MTIENTQRSFIDKALLIFAVLFKPSLLAFCLLRAWSTHMLLCLLLCLCFIVFGAVLQETLLPLLKPLGDTGIVAVFKDYGSWYERHVSYQYVLYVGLWLCLLLMVLSFLLSLPALVARAEQKAWQRLKLAEKNSNHQQAIKQWRQAMGLLTPARANEFSKVFPRPEKKKSNATNTGSKAAGKKNRPLTALEEEDLVATKMPSRQQSSTSRASVSQTLSGKRQFKTLKVDKKAVITSTLDGTKTSTGTKMQRPATTASPRSSLPFYIGSDNRYRLDSVIASGGMGKVYGGEDTVLQRVVAVKELFSHLTEDAEQVERFRQEALMLASLNHRHIVPVYDMLNDGQHFWIVMQWLKGKSLASLLEKGRLALYDAVMIAAETADALDFAHQQGIIHRDVKPMNILLDVNGEARLTDFGTAKLSSSVIKTVDGAVLGSPAYMSPEQAAGQKLDTRSDIYSLGVTLFQFVTGDLPFKGNTAEVMTQHITQPAPAPITLKKDIGKPLNKLILKMLEKKPADRFQTMQDVHKALLALDINSKTSKLR